MASDACAGQTACLPSTCSPLQPVVDSQRAAAIQRVNCLDAHEFQKIVHRLLGVPSEDSEDSDCYPVTHAFAIVPEARVSAHGKRRMSPTWMDHGAMAAESSA